ncbi:MAG: hypothetical protein P4L46_02715 [Fimbriimonas sp.]|nr:hypothetical protein [Fimbriimonas sp.]
MGHTAKMLCERTWPAFRRLVEANLALHAGLDEIACLGGGTVEAYPFEVDAVKTSSSFLHAGTLRMFLDEGFEKARQIGKSQ